MVGLGSFVYISGSFKWNLGWCGLLGFDYGDWDLL